MAKNSELKAIRDELGLNQTQMGAELGVKQSGYQRWEDNPETPAAQEALTRARAVYQKIKKQAWKFSGETPGYMFTPREAVIREELMSPGEAAQRASSILREVIAAAPELREKWTDEDKDEFLGGVAQILTSVPKTAVADTLRQLLLAVAMRTMKKAS